MNEKFKRSPLGFCYLTSGQSFPKTGAIVFHGIREENPDVIALWDRYKTIVSAQPPIKLMMDAITVAKRVFGNDFLQWMTVQITANPDVTDYRVDILRDTVRFVNGYKREYGLNTWNTLLGISGNDSQQSTETKVDKFSDIVIPKTTVELVSRWLEQPNGADDMIHTLNILFGKY